MSEGTKRISTTFARLGSNGEKALVTYITAGDPDLGATLKTMHALVSAGADIIELGFPFSEPMADGPVIQRAIERSLAAGATLKDVLDLVAAFRKENSATPIVLMGYLNPVYRLGYEEFARRAAASGIDGVLIVDGPAVYTRDLSQTLRKAGIAPIFLLTPMTALSRVPEIVKNAEGFLYYVSFNGVTGAKGLNTDDIAAHLEKLRPLVSLPIAVGFGVKTPKDVKMVSRLADGVVIGSRLVDIVARAPQNFYPELTGFTRELKAATRVPPHF